MPVWLSLSTVHGPVPSCWECMSIWHHSLMLSNHSSSFPCPSLHDPKHHTLHQSLVFHPADMSKQAELSLYDELYNVPRVSNSSPCLWFFFVVDASECARFSCSHLLSVRNRVIRFKYFSIYIDQSSLSLFLLELSLSMVLNINFPKGILMYWYILFLAKQSWLFGGHGKTKSLEWDRLMLHKFLGVWFKSRLKVEIAFCNLIKDLEIFKYRWGINSC